MKNLQLTFILTLLVFTVKSQYSGGIAIESLLKTDTTITGQGFSYPGIQNDEITILKITFKPGQSTGWHKHEFPVFAYILQGELTAELETGRTLHYPEETSFAEVINTWHNGSNTGKEDLILIVTYLGEKGKELSVKKETIDP